MTPLRPGRPSLLLLLLLAAPITVRAGDDPPPLRWGQVVATVARQPLVREAEARAAGAVGAIRSAQGLPGPILTVTGADASARAGGGHRREWGYSVEQPLDFLATRGARVAAARAAAQGLEQESLGARARVVRALRRDFVALAHAQARLDAELELEAQVGALAGLVRRRAERGEARPTEVPRIEIEHERLRTGVDRARSAAEAQGRRFSLWMDGPVRRVEVDLAGTLPLPPVQDLLDRLLDQAPPIRAGQARLAAATEELGAERLERIPKLSITGARAVELDRSASSISATVTLPLWSWNAGRIRQAEAAATAEQARLEETRRELSAAASDAWQACAAGQATTARFREAILPRAEASARTTGRAFELGEAGLLDVIDTRRVLLDTRREYLDLLLDMQNACGDLAALAGLELP